MAMGVRSWVIFPALLASLIASHFVGHIWRGILQHLTSIQRALRQTPAQLAGLPTIGADGYMRTAHAGQDRARHPELTPLRNSSKGPTATCHRLTLTTPARSASTSRHSPQLGRPHASKLFVQPGVRALLMISDGAWADQVSVRDAVRVAVQGVLSQTKSSSSFCMCVSLKRSNMSEYKNVLRGLEPRRRSSANRRSWRQTCCARCFLP